MPIPPNPPHFSLESVIRPNILSLQPYRCARDDYNTGILLDANENALGHSISSATNGFLSLPLHRYPDPSHDPVKSHIASLRSLPSTDHVFLGVGSDECIDLLIRACVAPGGTEKILITPPTYGMYSVCAQVNDVGVVKCPLEVRGDFGEGGDRGRFSLGVDEIRKQLDTDPSIKLIFLCSPGNPTGTLLSLSSIRQILTHPTFKGILIVDEAYIDFASPSTSAVPLIAEFTNICILQTFSKSFGLASIRLGLALSQPPLIQILSNMKAPYNISLPTAHLALEALSPESLASMRRKLDTIAAEREGLLRELGVLAGKGLGVGRVLGANDANFVLVPILSKDSTRPDNTRASKLYQVLAEHHSVVVRFRGNELGCEGCLRITVGSEDENRVVVRKIEEVLMQI